MNSGNEMLKNHSLKIYQANVRKDFCFREYAIANRNNVDFKSLKDYNLVYEGTYESDLRSVQDILEIIFADGNVRQLRKDMADFCKTARSISVSDVIELDGIRYYVNPFGFIQIAGI